MPQLFNDVQPGDLISADLMNRIMHEVQSLEDRVHVLETTTPAETGVVYDSVFPSGPVQIGTDLHVNGRNFQYSVGSARASISVAADTREVTVFRAGSTDQELIIQIPAFPNIPLAGVAATLTVRNQTTSAQAPLTLLPTQTSVSGSVDVTAGGVSKTSFVAGDEVDFEYTLTSRTNLPATFTIDPQVTVSSNQPAWQAALQLLNANKSVNSTKTISLLAGEQKTFYVRIPAVPAAPLNATFALTVGATSPGVTPGSAGPSSYTVGQTVVVPDPAIVTLSVAVAQFNPSNGGSLDRTPPKDTLHVNPSAQSLVRLLVEFNDVGTYNLTVTTVSGTNWSVSRNTTTPASYTIQSSDLTNPQLKASRTPEFLIQPGAGASTAGEIEFSYQRTGQNPRNRRMLLALRRPIDAGATRVYFQ